MSTPLPPCPSWRSPNSSRMTSAATRLAVARGTWERDRRASFVKVVATTEARKKSPPVKSINREMGGVGSWRCAFFAAVVIRVEWLVGGR